MKREKEDAAKGEALAKTSLALDGTAKHVQGEEVQSCMLHALSCFRSELSALKQLDKSADPVMV